MQLLEVDFLFWMVFSTGASLYCYKLSVVRLEFKLASRHALRKCPELDNRNFISHIVKLISDFVSNISNIVEAMNFSLKRKRPCRSDMAAYIDSTMFTYWKEAPTISSNSDVMAA